MTTRGRGSRLWRYVLTFFIGGTLGAALGIAAGFFAYPYVFPPPPAMDSLSADEQATLVARGTFIHADPSDPIHRGKGGVSVYERVVFLEADFAVGPGPAFHVYLVPKPEIRRSADVRGAMYVDLGALRAFEGSQKYPIPPGVNLKDYPSVVIWCERFSVLISPAGLVFEGEGA